MNKPDYYQTKQALEDYLVYEQEDTTDFWALNKFRLFLESQDQVLELGSGIGTDWLELAKNYTVVGSDYSEVFVSFLQRKYPNGNFLCLNAISLQTTRFFEAIYSNKVLHYLRDEELLESISRQTEVLHPKAIICHTFWEGEGTDVFKGLFLQYYTLEKLSSIFSTQFEILLLEKYTEYDEEDSILLIARKK